MTSIKRANAEGNKTTMNQITELWTSPDRRPGCSLTSGATDGIATDQGSRNDAQDATIGVGGHRCYASHLPVSKWSVAVCLGKHQLVKHFELGMSKK